MSDQWKPVPGIEDLRVSAEGDVQRLDKRFKPARWRPVSGTNTPVGYKFVAIPITGKPIFIHRLVCLAFHRLPLEGRTHVAHADGDSTNNAASNLRWVNCMENANDRKKHGRYATGSKHHMAKMNESNVMEARMLYAKGARCETLARQFGVSATTIERAAKGITWKEIA
jgi:hypothetical protein